MEHTLTIHKLIHGGKGLGTLADGIKVMVPGVLPGETVTVRETKVHRGHKEAELVRVEQAAPERVEPPCPYYGLCGGCNLQHASAEAQLQSKRQILEESLLRSRIEGAVDHCQPTLPSPLHLGYRHRIRLHLDAAGLLGFHQVTSNSVVPIRRCLLATEAINRVLEGLIEAGIPEQLRGLISAIELFHSPADDRILLALHPVFGATKASLSPLPALLTSLADEVFLLPQRQEQGKRPEHDIILRQQFSLSGHEYTLSWDPTCFFQVNAQQNPRLIDTALHELDISAPCTALDLFCGMGNFSIPLALRGMQLTGIEHNRRSLHWAGRNAVDAGLTTCQFLIGDVEAQLRQLVKRRARFDCILLDPPRQGMGKAMSLLPVLQPRQIVSISCDPATQARDLSTLQAEGYQLRRITPVDMFPQTHHIESVALLERN